MSPDRTDQEWRSLVADEQSAAVAKVAEYGEEIDRLRAENARYRAALRTITELFGSAHARTIAERALAPAATDAQEGTA